MVSHVIGCCWSVRFPPWFAFEIQIAHDWLACEVNVERYFWDMIDTVLKETLHDAAMPCRQGLGNVTIWFHYGSAPQIWCNYFIVSVLLIFGAHQCPTSSPIGLISLNACTGSFVHHWHQVNQECQLCTTSVHQFSRVRRLGIFMKKVFVILYLTIHNGVFPAALLA